MMELLDLEGVFSLQSTQLCFKQAIAHLLSFLASRA
jgi:hypothetical protein